MLDRVSKYPGRVQLVPVVGMENTYTLTRADEPTQAGTPLSKGNLLSDVVAQLLGLDPAAAVPNDALRALLEKWTATDTYAKGCVRLHIGAGAPATIANARPGDVYLDNASTEKVLYFASGSENDIVWTPLKNAKRVLKAIVIRESQVWQVPEGLYGEVHILAFGGGAGGGGRLSGGYGGGGGHRSVWVGKLTESSYPVTIGAGGAANGAGGVTSFGTLVSATGGSGKNGGTGGGGIGVPGGNGSYGGGGGGGIYGSNSGGNGGTYGGGGGGNGAKGGNSASYTGGTRGGAGYSENGKDDSGGAGENTIGKGFLFEGTGTGGVMSGGGGGGGGYGGNGGNGGNKGGGGGGGYGGNGGNNGGGGGGYGGSGGDKGGGGGGYGLDGNGGLGSGNSSGIDGGNGGTAAGGGASYDGRPGSGGDGVVVIEYWGVE